MSHENSMTVKVGKKHHVFSSGHSVPSLKAMGPEKREKVRASLRKKFKAGKLKALNPKSFDSTEEADIFARARSKGHGLRDERRRQGP